MTATLTALKWPTMAETRKRAKRTIKGWVELRGHKAAKPKLAKFTINYAPRISLATKRVLANAWTAYVQTTFGSGHMRPLGRFHNPEKALARITQRWRPRNQQAVHFGKGSAAVYRQEVIGKVTEEIEQAKTKVLAATNGPAWVVAKSLKHGGGWTKKAHLPNAEGALDCAAHKATAKRRGETVEEANKFTVLADAGADVARCGFCKQKAAKLAGEEKA
jgi:hypothetical protein